MVRQRAVVTDRLLQNKVIRLFINIDWSNLTETLTLPDNIVLDGQGYNVKLGSNGSIEGNLKDIYISGKSISDI